MKKTDLLIIIVLIAAKCSYAQQATENEKEIRALIEPSDYFVQPALKERQE